MVYKYIYGNTEKCRGGAEHFLIKYAYFAIVAIIHIKYSYYSQGYLLKHIAYRYNCTLKRKCYIIYWNKCTKYIFQLTHRWF